MSDETSSWHAELDLRVFATLLTTPGGQADIGPEHALGIRTDLRSIPEVVNRIHFMVDRGWIDAEAVTSANVRRATLAPCLKQGLAVWKADRALGDVIRQVLSDDDIGRPVDPERFVALRDEAIWYCGS